MPRVSVILPIYNSELYLRASIASVLAQSFTNFEFLLINDGSTDTSLSIIQSLAPRDARIKIINNSVNKGLVSALNQGIAEAQGEYLARIDADDTWSHVDKLAEQVKYLDEHLDCGLVGTAAELVDVSGRVTGKILSETTDAQIRRKLLIKNQFIHSSVLVRKSAVMASGGYVEAEKYVEDYGLWLRIGERYRLANLSLLGLKYLVNPKGITSIRNRLQVINSFKLIYRHRSNFPNYILALIKWSLRYLQTLV